MLCHTVRHILETKENTAELKNISNIVAYVRSISPLL